MHAYQNSYYGTHRIYNCKKIKLGNVDAARIDSAISEVLNCLALKFNSVNVTKCGDVTIAGNAINSDFTKFHF